MADNYKDSRNSSSRNNRGKFSSSRNTIGRQNVGGRDIKPSSRFGKSDKNPRFSSENSDNGSRASRDFVRKNDNSEKPMRFSKNSSRRDDTFKEKSYSHRFTSESNGSYKKRDDSRRDTYGAFRKNVKPHARPRIKTSHNFDSDDLENNATHKQPIQSSQVRLNRFIANAGYCSRREADDVIRSGKVTVNGSVVTELGVKVNHRDTVLIEGVRIQSQKKVYILFNKPKDCITTKKDPEGRRTVYDLIAGACEESVEAVGRLDRNTTGLLLFTNDGDLAHKLTHPKHEKMKIYHAFLDRNLQLDDFEIISAGLEIEGEFIKPDDLQYVAGDKSQLGIQIHSGKYHIVKRIFEMVGYRVEKLDRVYFAGLTKKNLPRGKWRFLTEKEITVLKQGAYE